MHVFIYDDFWFSKLPLTGLAKTGPIRARFLNEAVADLREQLRQLGNDLIVRKGSSAQEIARLAKALGVKKVYAFKEVCEPRAEATGLLIWTRCAQCLASCLLSRCASHALTTCPMSILSAMSQDTSLPTLSKVLASITHLALHPTCLS